jgi:hypothetical protein
MIRSSRRSTAAAARVGDGAIVGVGGCVAARVGDGAIVGGCVAAGDAGGGRLPDGASGCGPQVAKIPSASNQARSKRPRARMS